MPDSASAKRSRVRSRAPDSRATSSVPCAPSRRVRSPSATASRTSTARASGRTTERVTVREARASPSRARASRPTTARVAVVEAASARACGAGQVGRDGLVHRSELVVDGVVAVGDLGLARQDGGLVLAGVRDEAADEGGEVGDRRADRLDLGPDLGGQTGLQDGGVGLVDRDGVLLELGPDRRDVLLHEGAVGADLELALAGVEVVERRLGAQQAGVGGVRVGHPAEPVQRRPRRARRRRAGRCADSRAILRPTEREDMGLLSAASRRSGAVAGVAAGRAGVGHPRPALDARSTRRAMTEPATNAGTTQARR